MRETVKETCERSFSIWSPIQSITHTGQLPIAPWWKRAERHIWTTSGAPSEDSDRSCESTGVLQCVPPGADRPAVEVNITYPTGNDYLILFLLRGKKNDRVPVGSM